MVSDSPRLMPSTAPAWNSGFFRRFRIPRTGAVTKSTARMVTSHVLPAKAFIPLFNVLSIGETLSFASRSTSYFSFIHLDRVRCVFSADRSNCDTRPPALCEAAPARSATVSIFVKFRIIFERAGSVRSAASMGISIRIVSAIFLAPFRWTQCYLHGLQQESLYAPAFLIKFIRRHAGFLEDMMEQAGFSSCLNQFFATSSRLVSA